MALSSRPVKDGSSDPIPDTRTNRPVNAAALAASTTFTRPSYVTARIWLAGLKKPRPQRLTGLSPRSGAAPMRAAGATGPDREWGGCGTCAFWRRLRDGDGVCYRWAPEASTRPETTAHWPLTHQLEGCGDGLMLALGGGWSTGAPPAPRTIDVTPLPSRCSGRRRKAVYDRRCRATRELRSVSTRCGSNDHYR